MRLFFLFMVLFDVAAFAQWTQTAAGKASDFEVSFELVGAATYKISKETRGNRASYGVEIDRDQERFVKSSNAPTFSLLEQEIRVLVEKERRKKSLKICSQRARIRVKEEGKEILDAEICLDRLSLQQKETLTEWMKMVKIAARATF